MNKLEFIIEDATYKEKDFKVIKLKINDKIYYLGTLKEYNDFCYIQTKSKKYVDKK